MSLVPTIVQTQEGHWYENPVIFSEDRNWFICYDYDDPIELVIKKSSNHNVEDILRSLLWKGWHLRIIGKGLQGERLFQSGVVDVKFEPARSYFLEQLKGAPSDAMIKEGKRVPDPRKAGRECVFYTIGR
jgi:hypothetical protein